MKKSSENYTSKDDLVKSVLEKCSGEVDYNDVIKVCDLLFESIKDSFLKINTVDLGIGEFKLKSRKANQVFSDKSEMSIVLRGNVNYNIKKSLIEEYKNNKEIKSKLDS